MAGQRIFPPVVSCSCLNETLRWHYQFSWAELPNGYWRSEKLYDTTSKVQYICITLFGLHPNTDISISLRMYADMCTSISKYLCIHIFAYITCMKTSPVLYHSGMCTRKNFLIRERDPSNTFISIVKNKKHQENNMKTIISFHQSTAV